MATSIIKSRKMLVREVKGTQANIAVGEMKSIAAPNVDGYHFVCWIGSAASGWTAATNLSNPIIQSTNWFVVAYSSGTTHNVAPQAWALYEPN